MKPEQLLDALAAVDDASLEEVNARRQQKKSRRWGRWAALAACLCLVTGIFLWRSAPAAQKEQPGITLSEDGVTIPPMEVSLSANENAAMLAFFIYQGRCYVQYEWIDHGDALVGEYLGTATGLIDEWTPQEGYVDLAGSVQGDFYAVNGYDPSFMLCMAYEDGQVSTYVCNTGITLKYGQELFEDRLHLSENLASASWETRESWYHSQGEVHPFQSEEALSDFLAAIDEAEFLPSDQVQPSLVDLEEYHFYLELTNGTTVHLRLSEGGYVRYQGIWDVCVQIPPEIYQALCAQFTP